MTSLKRLASTEGIDGVSSLTTPSVAPVFEASSGGAIAVSSGAGGGRSIATSETAAPKVATGASTKASGACGFSPTSAVKVHPDIAPVSASLPTASATWASRSWATSRSAAYSTTPITTARGERREALGCALLQAAGPCRSGQLDGLPIVSLRRSGIGALDLLATNPEELGQIDALVVREREGDDLVGQPARLRDVTGDPQRVDQHLCDQRGARRDFVHSLAQVVEQRLDRSQR